MTGERISMISRLSIDFNLSHSDSDIHSYFYQNISCRAGLIDPIPIRIGILSAKSLQRSSDKLPGSRPPVILPLLKDPES